MVYFALYFCRYKNEYCVYDKPVNILTMVHLQRLPLLKFENAEAGRMMSSDPFASLPLPESRNGRRSNLVTFRARILKTDNNIRD